MSKLSLKNHATVDLTRSKRNLISPFKKSRITIDVLEDMAAQFKAKVASNKTTFREVLTEMIEKYLKE